MRDLHAIDAAVDLQEVRCTDGYAYFPLYRDYLGFADAADHDVGAPVAGCTHTNDCQMDHPGGGIE